MAPLVFEDPLCLIASDQVDTTGEHRLDLKVLAWLKSKGVGHLTRINDILVNLMEAESRSR